MNCPLVFHYNMKVKIWKLLVERGVAGGGRRKRAGESRRRCTLAVRGPWIYPPSLWRALRRAPFRVEIPCQESMTTSKP